MVKLSRQAGLGATPEGLLTKVEEEVKVRKYICFPPPIDYNQRGPSSEFYITIIGERVHRQGQTTKRIGGLPNKTNHGN